MKLTDNPLDKYPRVDEESRKKWEKALKKYRKELRKRIPGMLARMRWRAIKTAELSRKRILY